MFIKSHCLARESNENGIEGKEENEEVKRFKLQSCPVTSGRTSDLTKDKTSTRTNPLKISEDLSRHSYQETKRKNRKTKPRNNTHILPPPHPQPQPPPPPSDNFAYLGHAERKKRICPILNIFVKKYP